MSVSAKEIRTLCRIIDSPTSTISAVNLTEHFGSSGASLLEAGALIQAEGRNDTESMTDHDGKSVEVIRYDGKNQYFSPTAGWVEVPSDELLLYRFCPTWLITCFKGAFGIAAHVEPRVIAEGSAWSLGDAWLNRSKHPIILVTQLRRESIFSAVCSHLEQHHNKRPALLITLDHQLPPHTSLPAQNRFITLSDAINVNDEVFALNADLLAEKMGASVQQQGFSNGYRSAYINGETYSFTKTQAEVIEVMDKAGKSMHQSEILADTSSSQERLIGVFRTGNKTHPAWDKVIVGDGSGTFRLEY